MMVMDGWMDGWMMMMMMMMAYGDGEWGKPDWTDQLTLAPFWLIGFYFFGG